MKDTFVAAIRTDLDLEKYIDDYCEKSIAKFIGTRDNKRKEIL